MSIETGNTLSRIADDRSFAHHRRDARGSLLGIVQHRAGKLARDQVAGIVIGAVGINLARHSEAQLIRRAFEFGAGHHDIDQLAVDGGDGVADSERRRAVDRSEVGQCAVRLDMADAVADRPRHPLQGADLVHDHLFDVLGLLALKLAPPKPPDVEKARMCADPDAVFLGQAYRVEHDKRIAAVKAAGDIRRRDDLQHLGVAAHRPGAKALAHVAVEVDHVHRSFPGPFSTLSFSTPYMGGICRLR